MITPLIIVSGLPRSGTSLMMQILETGGVKALTDGVRSADGDNPRGYFEWEGIKKIDKDHRVLEPAAKGNKAVKVISTLLPKLPKAYRYKILFMERDLKEVVRSQKKMLIARGEPIETGKDDKVIQQLKKHNDHIIRWMETAPHIDALMINHRKLIQRPAQEISKIVTFLEPERSLSSDIMAEAVDPELYRNRSNPGLLLKLNFLRR